MKDLLTFGGEFAPETFDREDVAQHIELLRLVSKRKISGKEVARTTWLYVSRRNTMPLNLAVTHTVTPKSNSNGRVEPLQVLLLQAAKECGLEDAVKDFFLNGRMDFRPLELEFLRTALEKAGYSKDFFVFED